MNRLSTSRFTALTLASLVAVGLSLAPQRAEAIAYALEPTQIANNVLLNTINGQLTTLNTTEQRTNIYLSQGQGGGPGGFVAHLTNIEKLLGENNAFNNEVVDNTNMAASDLEYRKSQRDAVEDRMLKPSQRARACVAATRASGGGGAAASSRGASGGAGGSLGREFNAEQTEIEAMAATVATRSDYCTQADVAGERPGCKGQGVGDRPDADRKASSIFDGGAPAGQQNFSLDEEGLKAAMSYVRNIAPAKLPLPTKEAQKTQAGVLYMIDHHRYNARVGGTISALTNIIGFGVAMGTEAKDDKGNVIASSAISKAGAASFLSKWEENKDVYARVFPGEKFPETPSERELLRLEVFKYYSDPTELTERASKTSEELAQDQIALAALNARIQLALLERTEYTNILLATIVSNQLEPLDQAQLKSRATQLGGTRAAK